MSSRVAVVTGVNSGIGRATAIHLASQQMHVFGTVRSVDKAAKLRTMAADAGVTVELVELDVANDDSVARASPRSSNVSRPSTCSSTMPASAPSP